MIYNAVCRVLSFFWGGDIKTTISISFSLSPPSTLMAAARTMTHRGVCDACQLLQQEQSQTKDKSPVSGCIFQSGWTATFHQTELLKSIELNIYTIIFDLAEIDGKRDKLNEACNSPNWIKLEDRKLRYLHVFTCIYHRELCQWSEVSHDECYFLVKKHQNRHSLSGQLFTAQIFGEEHPNRNL